MAAAASEKVWAKRLSKLADLSESDVIVLGRLTSRSLDFRAHLELQQKERPDGLLIVLEGFACRFRKFAVGRQQNVAYFVPGDIIDITSKTEDGICALSKCRVAPLSREIYRGLIEQHPQIGAALRSAKIIEEAITREWLINLGARNGRERIAHFLCEMLVRLNAVGLVSKNSCAFPISQADLSATLGLSPVHVNRSLQDLRQEGMIELKSRVLHVEDFSRLERFAGFTPQYLQSHS